MSIFKKMRKLYWKLFVEGTLRYRLGMLFKQWEAEQDAVRDGREYCKVPFEDLERM